MDEQQRTLAETEAYLAKIRKTIRASRDLIETARLRISETDRLLEQQGLTREQLANLTITPEQQRLAEAELKRLGFDSLPEATPEAPQASFTPPESEDPPTAPIASVATANFSAGDGDGSVENRKRKFNVMLQQFRM